MPILALALVLAPVGFFAFCMWTGGFQDGGKDMLRRLLLWLLLIAPGVLFGLAILRAHRSVSHFVCGSIDKYGCTIGEYRHVPVPWSPAMKLAMFGVMAVLYLVVYGMLWVAKNDGSEESPDVR